MFPLLPAIAYATAAPSLVWRGSVVQQHDDDASAADLLRQEQQAAGRSFGLSADLMDYLDTYPAAALLWVAFARSDTPRLGSAAGLVPLRLDIPAFVLMTDSAGAFLLFFPDDEAQFFGGSAMPDQFSDDVKAWIDDRLKDYPADYTPDPATRLELAFEASYSIRHPDANFHQLEASGALDPERAEFFALHQQQPQAEIPAPAPKIDDEDEKRRASRGGGDMGNPANAAHALDIRPDTAATPAGLETITTMKSRQYDAFPSDETQAETASAHLAAKLEGRAGRFGNDGERPAPIDERIAQEQPEAAPVMTLEAIAQDPWNAVALPLPENADAALLDAAKSAASYCAEREHGLMEAARAGDYTPPGWTPEPESPDVHEENEAFYLDALDRLDEIEARQLTPAERDASPEAVQQRDAAESGRRQTAELDASQGQSLPPELSSTVSDLLAAKLDGADRKEEHEAEGEMRELVTHEPTGGGRGIF